MHMNGQETLTGLVDDSENIETGDDTGVLGAETLGVVEAFEVKKAIRLDLFVVRQKINGGSLSRDGDDSLLDGLAELGLSGLLQFCENHGGDFLGGEDLVLVEVLN